MKQPNTLMRLCTSVAVIALLAVGFSAAPALAQDQAGEIEEGGQEHRERFNDALETARAAQASMQNNEYENAYELFSGAREDFIEAAQLAEERDDADVVNMANQRAAQMAYFSGRMADRLDRHEDALEQFEAGIEVFPDYAQNYLGRAVSLRKMDRMDEAMDAYAEAMEMGDQTIRQEAERAIRSNYHHLASRLLGQETVRTTDANQALEHLDELESYVEPNADTYFYRAVAHDALGNMSDAIQYSTQSLEMLAGGSATARARVHLIRGEAHLAAGNTGQACEDFQAANVGDYQQRAQHHLQHSCN